MFRALSTAHPPAPTTTPRLRGALLMLWERYYFMLIYFKHYNKSILLQLLRGETTGDEYTFQVVVEKNRQVIAASDPIKLIGPVRKLDASKTRVCVHKLNNSLTSLVDDRGAYICCPFDQESVVFVTDRFDALQVNKSSLCHSMMSLDEVERVFKTKPIAPVNA